MISDRSPVLRSQKMHVRILVMETRVTSNIHMTVTDADYQSRALSTRNFILANKINAKPQVIRPAVHGCAGRGRGGCHIKSSGRRGKSRERSRSTDQGH